jgi:hypothetical protein
MNFLEQQNQKEKVELFYNIQIPNLCEQLGINYDSKKTSNISISKLINVLSSDTFSAYWGISPANDTIKKQINILQNLQTKGLTKSPLKFILSLSDELNCLFCSSFYAVLSQTESELFFEIRKHLAQIINVFNNVEIKKQGKTPYSERTR